MTVAKEKETELKKKSAESNDLLEIFKIFKGSKKASSDENCSSVIFGFSELPSGFNPRKSCKFSVILSNSNGPVSM